MINPREFINRKLEQRCKHCKKRQKLLEQMIERITADNLQDLREQYRDWLVERFEKDLDD